MKSIKSPILMSLAIVVGAGLMVSRTVAAADAQQPAGNEQAGSSMDAHPAAGLQLPVTAGNGLVVITLVKDGEQGWVVPADSSLTDTQYTGFKNGGLSINVHSEAHEAGEIRAQLQP